MKNNQKQTSIIKTAIRCIAQFGIEGASADVIARKMGIAQSGIFYYFPSQEELFDSLVVHIAGVNHALVTKHLESAGAQTARERLIAHLTGNLLWAEKNPDHVSVLLVSIAKTGRSRKMRDRIDRLFAVGELRLLELLKEGIKGAEFTCEEGSEALALFLHKALTGIIVSYYYSRHHRSMDFYKNLLLGQVRQKLIPAKSLASPRRSRGKEKSLHGKPVM